VAANAERVAEMGRELHKRVSDLAAHVVKLGRHLAGSVESYNAFVGSLESRVLPTARRFRELEAAGAEVVPEIPTVDSVTRVAQATELAAASTEK
jgi:DNA recombination protein RmuC